MKRWLWIVLFAYLTVASLHLPCYAQAFQEQIPCSDCCQQDPGCCEYTQARLGGLQELLLPTTDQVGSVPEIDVPKSFFPPPDELLPPKSALQVRPQSPRAPPF